jgi:hypothetical protein
MGNRRLALLVGASLCISSSVLAQPAEGEIEMEGDPPPTPQPEPAAATTAEQPAEPAADQPAAPPAVVKDPKVAKKWLQAGDQLIKKGDQLTKQNKAPEALQQYENAVTAYQKAIEASDDVGLNYQLAIALDKAGMTPDALKHIKLVLAAPGLKPALMKNAQKKLDELSMKVGTVALMITPEGTQVMMGDKQIGETPLAEPLVLMPGTHTVTLTAVGYQPKDVELKVEAGSESERTIALDPVPIIVKPQVLDVEPIKEEPIKGPSMLPVYIGAGATLGLVITATITGITAVNKHSWIVDPEVPPADRDAAASSGKTLALVTDLCIVGAVGAAAFTAYWYQYRYRPARAAAEQQKQAKVDVVPWVQPQAGGLTVAGSF